MGGERLPKTMFCPNCKGLMRPGPGGAQCGKCGYKGAAGAKSPSLIVSQKATEDPTKGVIVDVEKDKVQQLPTTTAFCEKCGHDQAYYFFRQTRAADEATTRFHECVKCGYRWRDYR